MAHSGMRILLISRELIATAWKRHGGHQWDGIFAIGLRQEPAGLMMGMVRSTPSVFVHGGCGAAGQMPGPDGRDLNVVDNSRTIGKVLAGTATHDGSTP